MYRSSWAGASTSPRRRSACWADGAADACVMTRALICDPQLPGAPGPASSTTSAPASGATRPASATSTPATPSRASSTPRPGASSSSPGAVGRWRPARVLVVGGGPGGLKAAATAAECGHDVVLHEAGPADRWPGTARPAAARPGRVRRGGHQPPRARRRGRGSGSRWGAWSTPGWSTASTPIW